MKFLIIILFALGLTIVNKPAYKDKLDIQNNTIQVEFDQTLKFTDLVAIKLKLESRDIYITYEDMEFDKKGQLTNLSYKLDNKSDIKNVILNNNTR